MAILVALPAPVRASSTAPPFFIGSIECEWLDSEELTRILSLELSSIDNVDELPPLAIDITCDQHNVIVSVTDPEQTQKIERTVPEPEDIEEERERQIALIIAQFAGALWRLRVEELSVVSQDPGQTGLRVEVRGKVRVKEKSVSLSLETSGGIRVRTIESKKPFLTGFGEFSSVFPMGERLSLVSTIGVEGSRADRTGGEVGAFAITAGMGVSGLLVIRPRFLLDARFLMLGGYARFEGRANDPNAYTDRVSSGGAGDTRIEIVPTFLLDRVAVGLCIEGGYGLKVVVAEVRDDENVTFGGWWVGVGVRVVLELGV